jgi:glycosyltransferase involved in cell wall biosynthesis
MRVLISPLVATSVINQAELIKKLLEDNGYEVYFKSTISVWDTKDEKNIAFLWFTLATFQFVGDAVAPYLMTDKPKAVYVTIEGIPTKANFVDSNVPRMEFIANSFFTRKCLIHAGLKVKDVVHHAVDIDLAQKAIEQSKGLREKFENEFGNRVKFLYVGRNDPRKGLEYLRKAMIILNEKMRDEFVLLLHSEGNLDNLLMYPNVIKVGDFGSIDYFQVLKLMASVDYVVFPSLCEGFGLPVLEANSVGIPVIHSWFEPLSEFSSKKHNFVFDYMATDMVKCSEYQYWMFHVYNFEILAEMMKDAIKIYKDSRSEYNEYCELAKEHAKNWDYRKIYPKLLSHLNIKIEEKKVEQIPIRT